MIWLVVAALGVVVVMVVVVAVARGADELRRLQQLAALDVALDRAATLTPVGDADGDDHTADDEGHRPVGDGQGDDQGDAKDGQAPSAAALR